MFISLYQTCNLPIKICLKTLDIVLLLSNFVIKFREYYLKLNFVHKSLFIIPLLMTDY